MSEDGGCAIRFDGVSKAFGDVVALDNVSFDVPSGAVTALLGPNGAGKTSAIRVLLGHTAPDAGAATLFGQPLRAHREPFRHIGVVAECVGLEPQMTPRRFLTMLAVAGGVDRSRVMEALAETGVVDVARRPIGTLSTGMRQRVAIAASLLGDPDCLVLDEPMNGLDPEGILWLRRFLRAAAARGRTVMLSSHILSEVEQIADHVVLIRQRVLFSGDLAALVGPSGRLEDRFFDLVGSTRA